MNVKIKTTLCELEASNETVIGRDELTKHKVPSITEVVASMINDIIKLHEAIKEK